MKEIRTRFAPSPTGFMHIGGVRTALFSYLIAKHNNGSFILRIEDTDQTRYVEGSIEVIYNTLRDLGLNWDEGPDIGGKYGPYVQSERKNNYLKYAQQLIDEGQAYYCFCNEDRLEDLKKIANNKKIPYKYDGKCRELNINEVQKRIEEGEKYVIRFQMPRTGKTIFDDKVYGKITVHNIELEDLIIIKSDLMPTYNFANIIDDHEMDITHIVRGNEFVSSTPKYVLIYQAFGWNIPEFIHLPVIKKEKDSDKKLSKRDGDATVEILKEKGYLNESIINMLALTGWSPGNEKEIFSLNELIEVFDISGISKGNAIFDVDKLNWFNNNYIRKLSIKELCQLTIPYLQKSYDLTEKSSLWLEKLVSIYQEQLSYGAEIIELTKLFFEEELEYDKEALDYLQTIDTKAVISTLKEEIIKINDWNEENIVKAINNIKEKTGIKGKPLFMPIRICVSGKMHGPELPMTIFLLGKEKLIKRL